MLFSFERVDKQKISVSFSRSGKLEL